MRLEFRPYVLAFLEVDAMWYDEQKDGLGEELLDDVQGVLKRVKESPGQFPIVQKRPEVRRALLNRFQFAVYFRVIGDSIVVVGIVDARRSAKSWRQFLRLYRKQS